MQNSRRHLQLDARLARYVLTAGAAIGAAKAAKGAVVVTFETTPIDFTVGTHLLDVNGDGVTDFLFTGLSSAVGVSASSFQSSGGFTFTVPSFDGILVNGPQFQAEAFLSVVVGLTGQIFGSHANMSQFTESGTLFAGLEFFDTNGFLHYGFAEFDPGQLLGFAYESGINTPIATFNLTAAPEPNSIEMLALGAAGLEILRRKRAGRVRRGSANSGGSRPFKAA